MSSVDLFSILAWSCRLLRIYGAQGRVGRRTTVHMSCELGGLGRRTSKALPSQITGLMGDTSHPLGSPLTRVGLFGRP